MLSTLRVSYPLLSFLWEPRVGIFVRSFLLLLLFFWEGGGGRVSWKAETEHRKASTGTVVKQNGYSVIVFVSNNLYGYHLHPLLPCTNRPHWADPPIWIRQLLGLVVCLAGGRQDGGRLLRKASLIHRTCVSYEQDCVDAAVHLAVVLDVDVRTDSLAF